MVQIYLYLLGPTIPNWYMYPIKCKPKYNTISTVTQCVSPQIANSSGKVPMVC